MATHAEPTSRKAQARETRARILDAAIELFAARHYDEVAVGDIATAAGVAHGLLFHYFKNKRGIYLAAMENVAAELESARRVDLTAPPGMQIRQLYVNHFSSLAHHHGLALRLVLGGRGADPEAWQVFEATRWRSIEWLCTLLGLDARAHALRMTLHGTAAALDETAAYWYQHEKPFDISVLTDVLLLQTITALRGAALLDSTLDVDHAIDLLGDAIPGIR